MKNDRVEKIFRIISVFVGCGGLLIATRYINEKIVQQNYAYYTGKLLALFSSLVVGIVVGVIFYLLYFFIRRIVEKNKRKKK